MRRTFTYDDLLEMKDAGALTASAAATVDGVAQIVDVGSGLFEGNLVVDVSAIEVDTATDKYEIRVEGSTKSDFSNTYTQLASLMLGHKTAISGDVTSTTGRYILPFTNEKNGVIYRYLRVYVIIAGTIATGINFTAHIGKR